ncbi:hypothetical protein NITHO_5780002 [Nitrolancea hollandica Lb]|uniref:Uncharacterized protein n=1 Tax=Nitrolancea hollandica Lb TaxID=1129897 RepID=I4EM98_9BACT|nr:hypothetical protein NITHO_5780002 [Nitrolancea hollandica Lb]
MSSPNSIRFRFNISFIDIALQEDYEHEIIESNYLNLHPYPHALFYNWLPNGEQDSIVLDTEEEDAELRVWLSPHDDWRFHRPGRRQGSQDPVVDPAAFMNRSIYRAGPLEGELRLKGVAEKDLAPLVAQRDNVASQPATEDAYRSLGRRVIKLIHKPVALFLLILRGNFGQHWIPSPPMWDSRKESMEQYCQNALSGVEVRFRRGLAPVHSTGVQPPASNSVEQ